VSSNNYATIGFQYVGAASINNYLALGTTTNASLCILPSGNVGIGITNPTASLTVYNASTSTSLLTMTSGATSVLPFSTAIVGEAYALSASAKNAYSVAGTVVSYYTTNLLANAGLLFDIAPQNASGATNVYFGGVAGGTANGPANFVIGRRTGATSWAESMRIDTSGYVGIGTNSIPTACTLYVYSNTNSGWDGRGYFGNATSGFVCGYFTNGVNNSVLIGGHNAALNAWANLTIGGGTAITSFPSSVGIGTTNPGSLLDVNGTIRCTNINANNGGTLSLYSGGTASTINLIGQGANGINIFSQGGSNVAASIYYDGSTYTYFTGGVTNSSVFFGAPGASSASFLAANGYGCVKVITGGSIYFPYFPAGSLVTNSSGQILISSDKRVKTNITYLSPTGSTLQIMKLKPATFNRLDDNFKEYTGFIAQDVDDAGIRNAVDGRKYQYQYERDDTGKPKIDADGNVIYHKNEDGSLIPRYLGFDTTAVVATLTLAFQEQVGVIQEQQTIIQQQSSAITSLESQVAALQTQLQQLQQRLG
jgi:hypothetical protein